jgi:ATP-dependent protease ClpP protease subunit
MPLPKPRTGEEQSDFMERCMHEATKATDDQKQAVAMCMDTWRRERGGTKPKAQASAPREIMLYGDIENGSAKEFMLALQRLKSTDSIIVAVNSGGGSIFEAEAIFNAIKRWKGRVTCRIDGVAASAASYVCMAGDEIVMSRGAHFMVHRPSVSGYMSANEDDLRDIIARFETLTKQMVRIYAQRSGQDEGRVREMMEKETWLTAEQAAQLGFCDRIDDELEAKVAAGSDIDRFGYRHVPVGVKAMFEAAEEHTTETEPPPEAPPKPQLSQDELEEARLRRARWKKRYAMMSAAKATALG